MARRGLAETTILKRMGELGRWLDHVGDRWPRATRADVESWLDRRDGLTAIKSRYNAVSNLSAFYLWAQRNELADHDPTALVERPRLPRTVPRPARRDQVDEAIEAADPSMAAALVLMADCGLRCCEVAALGWGDVDLPQGVIYVKGKGSHERMVGLPARAAMVLSVLQVIGEDGEAVVTPATTAAGISHRVRAYLHASGVPFSAHQLRHLYATRLLSATGDLTVVQRALGHSSVQTTAGYAAVDPVHAIEAAQALN